MMNQRTLLAAALAAGAVLSGRAAATENVTNLIARLDPQTANVVSNFLLLTDIPRPSGHEKAVSDALVAWATARGFKPTQNAQNNVWFDVPATAGMENKPRVILQGHMDMVAAGFGDPQKEAVLLDCDAAGTLFSKGRKTSIGADDGIGVALAMTVADGKVPHGPVRILVTTDEEQTQTGAQAVPAAVLQDATHLVNIDSEVDGELTISSAAADRVTVTGAVSSVAATLTAAYAITIRNFRGGHSGLDIDKGRLNAIIELGRILTNAVARGVSFELAKFTGGNADNAIPLHAEVFVRMDESSRSTFEGLLSGAQAAFRAQGETDAVVGLMATNGFGTVFTATSRANLLTFLTTVHNGAWGMSQEIPGLVETSINLGQINATENGVSVRSFARGSVDARLQEEEASVKATADACGYVYRVDRDCAAWPANPNNPLIAVFSNVWRTVTGGDMKVVAIHGGLECGWFASKVPALHVVSVGPTIRNPHTVNETTYASSVSNGVLLLSGVLAALPDVVTRTYYLDPGKGAAEGSGTASAPFRSFTNAIAVAGKVVESNVVIYVDNSKNNHCFSLDQTIQVDVPGKNITFQPWTNATTGAFNVVLDGRGKRGCVMVSNGITNTVTFKNFTLRNGWIDTDGGGAYQVTLVDSVITNCTAGVSGGGAYNCDLENCQLLACSANTGGGGGVFDSALKNCLIYGCKAGKDGGGASESKLYNCLVLKNKAPDGNGGGAFHSWLYNCTFNGNSAKYGGGFVSSHQLTNEISAVEVVNTIILDNGKDKWTSNKDREGDVFCRVFTDGDPKFVDAANGDYRLRADSPCIDCGYSGNDVLPTVDLAGKPRLRGAEIDLGCYEFQRHAAFYPGTLDVSTNAQVVGTVLYAQGPWRLAVNDEAKSWLSADVTGGSVTNTLRFTFVGNATGADRSAVVSVFTNGSDVAVQQITVRQVGSASGCAGTRRGVFVGCAKYEKVLNPKTQTWEVWQEATSGADGDARFYSALWCKAAATNDPAVCRILINENATSNNVLAAIGAVIDQLKPDDEFMLSIAGHGITVVPEWINYFILYPNQQYLLFSDISNCLIQAASRCQKAICCIDACNAAGVYKFADQLTCDGEVTDRRDMPRLTLAAAPSEPEPYKNESKIAFIVASDYDQFALSGSPNGGFTAALREGYETRAADADGNGFLDLHEIYRYAYYMASGSTQADTSDFVQGRCYNKPLLLKTIVGEPGKSVKPDVLNPLNPYYVDFVNWIHDGTLATIPNPFLVTNVTDVVTNAANRVPLAGGRSMSLADAFVAGYAPVEKGVTNAPFTVSITVTNGTPYLTWSPDRRQDAAPMRSYEIKANTSLTNRTNWMTFPASAPPEQLKPYNFFKVDVKLRQ